MKPIVQALLVADHVYTDVATGKKVVAGIFHTLRINTVTAQMQPQADDVGRIEEGQPSEKEAQILIPAGGMKAGSPFCYISLVELRGKVPFQLRYVELDDNKVLFRTRFSVECPDPLRTVEIVVPLPELPAPKPGKYALELLCDDEPLCSHSIIVEDLKGGLQ